MTDIIIIAAISVNGVIGKKNDIPWRIHEDFKRFKQLTMGFPCIMGDSTYKSLPDNSRPLPGRENIIVTLDRNYHPEGTVVFHTIEDSIEYVKSQGVDKAFITGGGTIYKLALPFVHIMELTYIDKYVFGDVLFPEYNIQDWNQISCIENNGIDRISGELVKFKYITLHRKYAK